MERTRYNEGELFGSGGHAVNGWVVTFDVSGMRPSALDAAGAARVRGCTSQNLRPDDRVELRGIAPRKLSGQLKPTKNDPKMGEVWRICDTTSRGHSGPDTPELIFQYRWRPRVTSANWGPAGCPPPPLPIRVLFSTQLQCRHCTWCRGEGVGRGEGRPVAVD